MDKLGSNVVCQVGLIVRDLAKTSAEYAALFGVPVPPVHETGPAEQTQIQYRGRTTGGRAKLAFFQAGQVSVELIEPIGGPSTWQEFLDEHGEGVHHIAFHLKGMKENLAFLDGRGMKLVQKGEYKGGRYAYVDASGPLKVILELLEND